jgi:hypothetical protein
MNTDKYCPGSPSSAAILLSIAYLRIQSGHYRSDIASHPVRATDNLYLAIFGLLAAFCWVSFQLSGCAGSRRRRRLRWHGLYSPRVVLLHVRAGIRTRRKSRAKRQADASREQVAASNRQAEIAAESLSSAPADGISNAAPTSLPWLCSLRLPFT